MPENELDLILARVAGGALPAAEAAAMLRAMLETGLGFARLDRDRPRRCGVPEVVFCPGKTTEQVVEIVRRMAADGEHVMATRISPEQSDAVIAAVPDAVRHDAARCVTVDRVPLPPPTGLVAVVTAGTADIPVAEEAALTAERMGAKVERLWDVGVAGLHRLLPHLERLRRSRAVIVVAGMEGALPSVVAGLIRRPVIGVPASVGYGVHWGGLTPLLAMLNSCVPGLTVVNIDNGFGAGVAAGMINRREEEP